MKTFICTICGYVFTGKEPPEFCPQCKAPASKFQEQKTQGLVWADEHRIGVAAGVDPEIIEGLRQNFNGECSEVGMYLAMSRVADRETEKAIRRLRKRSRDTLGKRRSMLRNLLSCWAKSFTLTPRKMWNCVP